MGKWKKALRGRKLPQSAPVGRRQIPLFVTFGDIFPRPGEVFLWDGAFGMAGKFLVAIDTLVIELTACALSVKASGFASSPKGRAKSTAGNFLITLKTLATNVMAWLSPWESWRGSA